MGPLKCMRIVEFAGIGPGPFAGMMLADMGAEILRIDRKGARDPGGSEPRFHIPSRGRKSITMDLKAEGATETVLRIIERTDALLEGYRPGVMERLGLGPEPCMARNPALVYGRMTGWGQDGPLAQAAGHDINYIALSGALWSIGETERNPVPPLNLVGDYGAGGMLLAFGMVCALLNAQRTGKGDVVDAAICDGTAALMAPIFALKAAGRWTNQRQANVLDGAAPFYGVYRCADGKWVSVAPLEPQFFALFLELLGLEPSEFKDRLSPKTWTENRAFFEGIFAGKTRAEWCELFEGTDICFAPVLDLEEAPDHAHNRARGVFVEADGVVQPAPAPRFTNAPAELPGTPPTPGQDNDRALIDWGFDLREVETLKSAGIL